jgi:phosphopantetheine adenylyltransferase
LIEITPLEAITLSKMLQLETTGLAMAKASLNLISDEDLKTLSKSGIQAAEARIKGLQQFVTDHDLKVSGEGSY